MLATMRGVAPDREHNPALSRSAQAAHAVDNERPKRKSTFAKRFEKATLLSLKGTMGESQAFPGFGEIDLDLPKSDSDPQRASSEFGQIDELGAEPASSTFEKKADSKANPHTKVTMRKLEDPDDPHQRPTPSPPPPEATRIVKGDSLSNLTRAKLAELPSTTDKTRMGSLDDLVAMSRGDMDESPPSVPSGSGIATREGRVAAMRELYAKGDAEGALQLAATLSEPPLSGIDRGWEAGTEDVANAIDVEIGEEVEIDIDLGEDAVSPPKSTAPAPVLLTLTERQGIPRVLKGQAEIAKLPIDHRAGFLLAHIDGMQTMEEILDICAMPPQEALQLIKELEKLGVIAIE